MTVDFSPAVPIVATGGITLLGVYLKGRQDRDRWNAEHERARRETTRLALVELIAHADTVMAAVRGAMGTGSMNPPSVELMRPFAMSEVAAEIASPPESWERINAYAEAVRVQCNYLLAARSGNRERESELEQAIRDRGLTNPDVLEGIRQSALDEIRKVSGLT